MKEHNKKYSAIDFARYHSGTMSPDEMHALEKAALEDAFLADAFDGYRYSKDAAKELGEMQARLDEKKKQQKVFSISSFSSGTWWKIAAMFILFAGAGYFFYASNSKQETSLEIKNDVLKKPNPSTIFPAKDDTTATEDNLAFEKTPPIKNENSVAKLPVPTPRSIKEQSNQKTLSRVTKTEKEKKILEEHLAFNKNKTITMKNSDKAISSNIIAKDSGEKSFFRPSDTAAFVTASPGVYNRDNNENAVAMNQKNGALNEVVVVGYGTQKKKSISESDSQKLEKRVSAANVTTSSPYPKEGKEKFDQYIIDNAVPVFDSTGKRISSNILLSFILNKKHKPAHIKVLESSCDACKKEAIRLLENGPNWIGNRGDSGTVRIQF
jgi:hypothetical protein